MGTTAVSEEKGFLQVCVSTAGEALPIEGATVTITAYDAQGKPGDLIHTISTDRVGRTPTFSLSAPAASVGMKPSRSAPYTEYRVEVSAKHFTGQVFQGVPVFAGIITVQPALLAPADTARHTPQQFPPYSSLL